MEGSQRRGKCRAWECQAAGTGLLQGVQPLVEGASLEFVGRAWWPVFLLLLFLLPGFRLFFFF